MFPLEQGAFEMLLIGAIALIVVGPKDLPMLMRKVGQFTAKMRGLAAEFRASFDEMARQSELDDLRKEVEALRTGTSSAPVMGEIEQHLSGFDPYPTGYPSPTPKVDEPAISPIADGGGDHPQGGEGAAVVPTPPPRSAVSLPTRGEDEVVAKPKKPRAPRKPKTVPVAHEAEG